MKLNKDTRDQIKEGTILTQKGLKLLVTNVITVQKGKLVTTKIINHSDSFWIGHIIYAQPMSWYYGMEIGGVKNET